MPFFKFDLMLTAEGPVIWRLPAAVRWLIFSIDTCEAVIFKELPSVWL